MPYATLDTVKKDGRRNEIFLNARTDTYAIMAVLLNQAPGPDLLNEIMRVDWHPATPERMIRAWMDLRNAARMYSAEEIHEEFLEVFVGRGQGEVVPYASWYLENGAVTIPLVRLRLDLIGLGIGRRSHVLEAEDHAGLLCETMALLGSSRAIPVGNYARFFDRHIAPWMFDFFTDVNRAPSAKFYRSVAQLGTRLLELEQEYLAVHTAQTVH